MVESGFEKFQSDVASGQLAAFSYIEPEWAKYPSSSAPPSTTQADNEHNFQVQNDQHPVSNLAVGEKLIHDVYAALSSNQAVWEKSLLIITYDEHGGNYDHVPPKPAPPHPTTSSGHRGSTSPASESGSRRSSSPP
jgi:phospholipase C